MTFEAIVDFLKEFGIFIGAAVPLYGAYITKRKLDNEKQKMNQELKVEMNKIHNQTEKNLLDHFEKLDDSRNQEYNKFRTELFEIIASQNETINSQNETIHELNSTISIMKKDLDTCHHERQKLLEKIID